MSTKDTTKKATEMAQTREKIIAAFRVLRKEHGMKCTSADHNQRMQDYDDDDGNPTCDLFLRKKMGNAGPVVVPSELFELYGKVDRPVWYIDHGYSLQEELDKAVKLLRKQGLRVLDTPIDNCIQVVCCEDDAMPTIWDNADRWRAITEQYSLHHREVFRYFQREENK